MRSVLPRFLVLVSLTAVVVPAAMGPASALPPPSTVVPAATSQPSGVQPGDVTVQEAAASGDSADTGSTTGSTGTTGALSEETLAQAQQTAKASGQRVEVRGLRTQTQTTWANPSGSLTTDFASGPVRVREDAQSPWRPVDLDLQPVGQGLEPAAAPVDVVVSDGRPGPAVQLAKGARSVGVGWPAPLPAPKVSGSVAEYDLGDGASLQLTATDDGALVRVLLSRAPAQAPVWRLPLQMQGLEVAERFDGSFVFTDASGEAVFEVTAPLMWDSAPMPEGVERPVQTVDAHIVRDASGVFLELAPSQAFLTDPDTVFPVVVDPDIASVQRAGDTWVREGVTTARSGHPNLYTGLEGTDKQRSFVKFDTAAAGLDGTQILDADLKLYNWWSGSCKASLLNVRPVNQAWPSPMVWTNQPSVALGSAYLVQKSFAHGNASAGCSADAFVSLDVTPIVAEWTDQDGTLDADNGFRLTSGEDFERHRKWFCSNDVSALEADKPCTKTSRRPTLSVTYNSVPAVPTNQATVVPSSPTPLPCVTGAARPTIATSTPTLSAVVSDPDLGNLYGKFEVAPTGNGANPVATGTSAAVASGSSATWQVPKGKLIPGATYSWRVRGYDLQRTSAYTGWCEFTVSLPAPVLNSPTTVHATGAELSWSPYQNPDEPAVEYQIHRGTTPGFAPSEATRVDSVPTSATSYTDTTAEPTAASDASDTGRTYYYRLVVKTTGGALVPSAPQTVQLPKAGRTISILTGASVSDTTLSSAQASTNLDSLGALKVGNNDTTHGKTRTVLDFGDLTAIPAGARVLKAELGLWSTANSGTGATFAAHALTRDFDETTATWNRASTAAAWTSPGGDYTATPTGTPAAVSGTGSWATIDVKSAVTGWRATPASNHGLLVRTVDEATPNQTVTFASSEAGNASQRPKLAVTYLTATSENTYYAPHTPERLVPNEDEPVTVTITNTTDTTWKAADWILSYHWRNPDGTEHSAPPDNPQPPTGVLSRDLAPGDSLDVTRMVAPPVNTDPGALRAQWVLAWELRNVTTSRWLSQVEPAIQPLAQNVIVEDPTSNQLGLEDFYQYVGQPTGAGSSVLVNQYTGNAAWSYDAFSNPSRGVNTFVRMTYNSLDTSQSSMGYGWSLSASTLNRLGSKLDFHPKGQPIPDQVGLIDGDGTSHTFEYNTATGEYEHPAGVHLFLQPTGTGDTNRAWVLTRPDRTKFYFDEAGYHTATVDNNGNELQLHYQTRQSNNEPTKFLDTITDSAGRTTLMVDYYVKHQDYSYIDDTGAKVPGGSLTDPDIIDQVSSITDISGRTITFTYTEHGLMAQMVDGAGTAKAKTFRFDYDPTQTNINTKLLSITDPIGTSTTGDATDHRTRLVYFQPPPGQTSPNHWKVQTLTDRADKITQFDYTDADGTPGGILDSTVTDANSHITGYRMDPFGRPTRITNPQSKVTVLGWDSDNNVVLLQEPPAEAGKPAAVTTWAYDKQTGYPLTIIDAEANKNGVDPDPANPTDPHTRLQYQYSLSGHVADLIAKTSPNGTATATADDFRWEFGYDANGNLTTVTDPEGVATATAGDYQTTYTYHTNDDGQVNGLLATVTDANGHTTAYDDYHASGYPTRVTDALGHDSFAGYDERGNVTSFTDANGFTSTYTYDLFGRPLETRQPKSATDTIVTPAPEYDANDNVTNTFAPYVNNPPPALTPWVNTYDAMDRLSSTTEPVDHPTDPQRKTAYTYDAVGNLTTVTEPKGTLTTTPADDFVTTYGYDSLDQLHTITDAESNTTTYNYYDNGDLKTIVDPKKQGTTAFTVKYTYDLNHRTDTETDASGARIDYGYDLDGRTTSVLDQENHQTTTGYDMRGLVTQVTVPHDVAGPGFDHRVTQYVYDEVGNRIQAISPRGTATTEPNDFLTQWHYDELNRVETMTLPYDPTVAGFDPEEVDEVTYQYDNVGNLTLLSSPPSGTTSTRADTSYEYFATGWVKSSTDPWDITTTYDYNAMGQQTQRTLTPGGIDDPNDARTMTWGYYPDGKLASRRDTGLPKWRQTVLVDDSDTQNTIAEQGWDPASDANKANHQGPGYLIHDAGTGTTKVTWNLTIPTAGSYQVYARAGAEATATNATYTIHHNGTQNTAAPVDQSTGVGQWKSLGTYTFAQGTNGQKVTLSDQANGVVAADAVKLVRVPGTGETDDEVKDYTYTYDPNANLTRISDNTTPAPSNKIYDLAYTELNQVDTVAEKPSVTAAAAKTTSYDYDANGNITSLIHTVADAADADQTSTYTYDDPRDLLTQVQVTSPTDPDPKTTTFTYDPRGLRERQVNDNDNIVSYDYFDDALLKSKTETKPDGTDVSDHQLTYTRNGHRASDDTRLMNATNNSAYLDFTRFYTYDPRDRVTLVEKKNPTGTVLETEKYDYDAASNITSQTVDDITTTFTYDRNRLLQATTSGITASYNYDPTGRLDTVIADDPGRTVLESYEYDGFDRVKKYTNNRGSGPITTTYTYDPLDRTTTRTRSAKTTAFTYLGLTETLISEIDKSTNKLTKTYQYTPWGERLSQVKHPATGTPESSFYGYNPHTDVETLTTAAGNTRATYGYTAYGQDDDEAFTGVDQPDDGDPTTPAQEPYNPYRYNGKRYDEISGGLDMGFRDYNPGLNRFLTLDSYNGALDDLNLATNPWTSNRYTLAGGNPITGIELDGHSLTAGPGGGGGETDPTGPGCNGCGYERSGTGGTTRGIQETLGYVSPQRRAGGARGSSIFRNVKNAFWDDVASGNDRVRIPVPPTLQDRGIILVRFFIPDEVAGFGQLTGDDRGFTADPYAPYRVAIAWNTHKGSVSFTTIGSTARYEASHLDMPLLQMGPGGLQPTDQIEEGGANDVNVHVSNSILHVEYTGINSVISCCAVNGEMSIDATTSEVNMNGDDYPSVEVYQYTRRDDVNLWARDDISKAGGFAALPIFPLDRSISWRNGMPQ